MRINEINGDKNPKTHVVVKMVKEIVDRTLSKTECW